MKCGSPEDAKAVVAAPDGKLIALPPTPSRYPTLALLAEVQAVLLWGDPGPQLRARLGRIEAYLIRRYNRDAP